MPFVEDPVHLSKTRLKSDLIAHNVELPAAASKKEVYVELHLKHIDQKNAADFSSDDEDPVQDVENNGNDAEDAKVSDPSSLTDGDLKAALLNHGVKAGPVVASTRALYEKKLWKLLHRDGYDGLNGAEKAVLYSDSEEEEEEGEGNAEEEEKEAGSEQEQQDTVEEPEQIQSSEGELRFQRGDVAYPQCFLLSSRLRACSSKNGPRNAKKNSRNALKSSEQTRSRCSQIPAGISRTSIGQRSGLRSGVPNGSKSVVSKSCSPVSLQAFSITQMVEEMASQSSPPSCTDKELNRSNMPEHRSWSSRLNMQIADENRIMDQSLYYTPKDSSQGRGMKLPPEPVKEILKDLIPDTITTPTGIYATSRRPIKGAARRPIQYAYPDTPVSPMTLERREVERHLVPIQIQILVFFIVAFILYFIYVNVEDSSSVLALLNSFNQCSDSKEGVLPQSETQDTQVVSGQD
ncbi:LEM domain-containing protein 1 [Melanotaenia boesemani]|uniref:LEM domain-containing protein 1 n=1 Tax=Melanotaenia boesemani TaxID=1250792 RepID=UPI001C03DE40|nr:LEM domain-containing protein 1 [Melanotaenia boesemani]